MIHAEARESVDIQLGHALLTKRVEPLVAVRAAAHRARRARPDAHVPRKTAAVREEGLLDAARSGGA
eukprot:scaffold106956_cov37-Tisochrysis_lutea.AAC.2